MRRKRVLAAAVLAALFSGILTLSFAVPAAALTGIESQFVSSHNSIRSSHGVRTLSVATDLVSVARRHSDRMAAAGTIWHNPNLGREVANWRVVGENVGTGWSVDSLMDAFMNSAGHRANILDRDYREFGVGVTMAGDTIYVTVVFVLRATTTTVRPRTTTTTRSRTTTTTRPRVAATASRPIAPAPPVPARPPVRTVSMLQRMNSLDN